MRLSTEQLDSFEKQGFLVLENFVSARQCENCLLYTSDAADE